MHERDGYEPKGDELDRTIGEDDFCYHNIGIYAGPGCPLSDPEEYDAA